MQSDVIRTTLTIARASETLGWFGPSEWPDLSVALLVEGSEDAEVAELAGLPPTVSGWDTDALVTPLYERYAVTGSTAEEAVAWLAATMAADLRARPAVVTAPMVRARARLAPPGFESELANRCHGAEEYLDCGCARVDERWIRELEALPGPEVPDSIIEILARRLRSTLPTRQPPRAH